MAIMLEKLGKTIQMYQNITIKVKVFTLCLEALLNGVSLLETGTETGMTNGESWTSCSQSPAISMLPPYQKKIP